MPGKVIESGGKTVVVQKNFGYKARLENYNMGLPFFPAFFILNFGWPGIFTTLSKREYNVHQKLNHGKVLNLGVVTGFKFMKKLILNPSVHV